MRWLAESLRGEQLRRLYLEIRGNGKWQYTDHACERMLEKGIRDQHVVHAIAHGTLITFDYSGKLKSVLLRDRFGTCVVVCLNFRNIMTVYKNRADDHHKTLDRTQYVDGPVPEEILRG